jgi:hypothetical protein
MGGVGDLGRAVGDGISGLVGGALAGIHAAFDQLVASFQSLLPGPALPIAVIAVVILLGWLVLKR